MNWLTHRSKDDLWSKLAFINAFLLYGLYLMVDGSLKGQLIKVFGGLCLIVVAVIKGWPAFKLLENTNLSIAGYALLFLVQIVVFLLPNMLDIAGFWRALLLALPLISTVFIGKSLAKQNSFKDLCL
jgi:hypothetical protein